MKKFIAASLALGAVCVLMPSAFADSFGYQASDSFVAANSAYGSSHRGFEPGASALPAESRFLFEDTFGPGNLGNRSSVAPDAIVDLSGHGLNLISGRLGGYRTAEGRNGHFSDADGDGYRAGSEISIGNSDLAAHTATLAATPEPGSLLLLGTGLLCLALFLFRKSAKHATVSSM